MIVKSKKKFVVVLSYLHAFLWILIIFIILHVNFISYENLLAHFWNCHDPTQLNRQGPDVGRQYRSAIFYYSDNQKDIAELSKKEKQNDFNNMIVTEIVEAQTFYLAEEYHQQFLKKRV